MAMSIPTSEGSEPQHQSLLPDAQCACSHRRHRRAHQLQREGAEVHCCGYWRRVVGPLGAIFPGY